MLFVSEETYGFTLSDFVGLIVENESECAFNDHDVLPDFFAVWFFGNFGMWSDTCSEDFERRVYVVLEDFLKVNVFMI